MEGLGGGKAIDWETFYNTYVKKRKQVPNAFKGLTGKSLKNKTTCKMISFLRMGDVQNV